MEIKIDDLESPAIHELLRQHLTNMAEISPPESVHALDLTALKKPDITFWSAWEDKDLLGCGALKELDAGHGEVKSMRTVTAHLRKGVARRLLETILDEAGKRGYTRVSLETGSMAEFEPARRLYASFGFEFCKPFGDYVDDPNSVFMTRSIGG